jgi:cytochrome c oxidase assembly protein subunit 16
MPVFDNKRFVSASELNGFGSKYRAQMKRHPFLFFGLPFLAVIISGSFVLTPATAIRYEKHDRKVRQMTREEELAVHKGARKVSTDIKEEYYVRLPGSEGYWINTDRRPQRLAAKDLDNWEQKRVKRLPGEPDGTL